MLNDYDKHTFEDKKTRKVLLLNLACAAPAGLTGYLVFWWATTA